MPTRLAATGRPARHGRLRSRRPAALIVKVLAAALAVVLVSGASVAAYAVWSITSAVGPGIALPGDDDPDAPPIGSVEGEVNLLLVGSDSGGGNPVYGERGEVLNDVTMLLHVSADHQRATVVSFPRDLIVDIPPCTGPDGEEFGAARGVKLNTALIRGGLACPVTLVEELSGLDVPYAAVIEFDGVIAMSNAVGGVPVCVATAIDDRQSDFQLAAGEHTLSGADALQFLRSRYGVGDGSDLTRISNQQQFLSSLVRTLKQDETLTNPTRLYAIAQAAVQNMDFSTSLQSIPTMVAIAGALADIPLEEVVFVRYPGVASGPGVVQDTDAANELFAAIAADRPIGLTGDTGGGTVVEETPEPTTPTEPDPGSGTPTPDPTATAEADRVELPPSVVGQNASQETCTAGQTAGGNG